MRSLLARTILMALLTLLPTLRAAGQGDRPPPEAFRIDRQDLAAAIEDYLRDHPPSREPAPWETVLEDLVLYGDLRIRHESTFAREPRSDRHRQRARLRLGVNYQLSEEVLLGARLATGDRHDPRSPHATFGDGFDNLEISLDRAFVTYRPAAVEGASITAGKFSHSFYRNPVYGELVWDADVQPEGILAEGTISSSAPLDSLRLRAGEYLLLEQATAPETYLSAFQAQATLALGRSLRAELAVGSYLFGDVTPGGAARLPSRNAGNALEDTDADGVADDFAADFRVLNPIFAVTTDALGPELVVSAEALHNWGARSDNDGWALGVATGRQQRQGDIRLYYQYQVIEKDATFSPLVQDDFIFGTNHRSHLFGINYQLRDRIGLHLWCLASRTDAPQDVTADDDTIWRLRLDLNIRF